MLSNMGKEETLTVLNLQAECDRLNKKILFLEKENREQRKELSDYAKREEQLLGEIETLESELREITREKLATLQDADYIFREEIANAGLDRSINQYFAVLTNMRSVGVMGDDRTYDYTLALRGVTTSDFMTADFARIPYDVLEKASVRIVNEVKNINRICYDITSKPPATIEWE